MGTNITQKACILIVDRDEHLKALPPPTELPVRELRDMHQVFGFLRAFLEPPAWDVAKHGGQVDASIFFCGRCQRIAVVYGSTQGYGERGIDRQNARAELRRAFNWWGHPQWRFLCGWCRDEVKRERRAARLQRAVADGSSTQLPSEQPPATTSRRVTSHPTHDGHDSHGGNDMQERTVQAP